MAFSRLGKKTASFKSSELGKMGQSPFKFIEIISFLMASTAIMDEGLTTVEEKSKGSALASLQEYKPFF